jgi:D-lactate dehydrogenase
MTDRRDELLKRSEIFSDLPNNVLTKIEGLFKEMNLERGACLFAEGDEDERIHLVKSGLLKASIHTEKNHEIFLRNLEPGQIVGATSPLTDGIRSATVVAVENSVLLYLEKSDLDQLLYDDLDAEHRILIQHILSYFAQKVRRKNRQYARHADKGDDHTLQVAFYDRKSYMQEIFDERNQYNWRFRYLDTRLSAETASLAAGCPVVCIFVNDIADRDVIRIFSRIGIRLIALRCAGFNNVDIEACREFGIDVVRVPAYSPHAVAEHAVAMLLTLNRKTHRAYQRVREGNFSLEHLVGFDLYQKTIGVIGTGKIGMVFAQIMAGFGVNLIAYDKYPNDDFKRLGGQYTDLDTLLATSDIISLHAPLTPETHHLISAERLSDLKPGIWLINTSRGALIDTKALISGIKSGQIGGAALDVYEEEADYFFEDKSSQVISDDILARLLTFNNVIITSHQAFLTREALQGIADTTIASIREFETGRAGNQLSQHAYLTPTTSSR